MEKILNSQKRIHSIIISFTGEKYRTWYVERVRVSESYPVSEVNIRAVNDQLLKSPTKAVISRQM